MQSGIIRFIDKGPLTSGRWYLLGLGATPRLMRECLNEVIPASGGVRPCVPALGPGQGSQ